jgi:hypothetical protein
MFTEEIAEVYALRALALASPEAIATLKERCEQGGIIGRDYDRCFYGQLAGASGVPFEEGMTPEQVFALLAPFCAGNLGAELHFRILDPIEVYCRHVNHDQTVNTSPVLKNIAAWCDEALEVRRDGYKQGAAWVEAPVVGLGGLLTHH